MASQLRIKDIKDLDTKRPAFKPNPNGTGHKGAPDKRYPILQSRAELRTYINHHHTDPRPEAPLWHVLRGYDPETPEEGAMSGDTIRGMLQRCKQRADIDKPANPHNFRHTAITRLSKQGFTRQEIVHLAGWADDKMLDAYDHTTDRERNDRLRAKAGFIDEAETDTSPDTPQTCGNCRETLKPNARFCVSCGAPTTADVREAAEAQEKRIFDSAAQAEPGLVEDVRELRELLNERPALRTVLLES